MQPAKYSVIDGPAEVIDYGNVFGESEICAPNGVDCFDTVLDK